MPYKMTDVQKYCLELSNTELTQCMSSTLSVDPSQRMPLIWKPIKNKVEKDFNKVNNVLKEDNTINPILIYKFLQSLHNAARYLEIKEGHGTDITDSRQETIKHYVTELKKLHKTHFPDIEVDKPRQEAQRERTLYRPSNPEQAGFKGKSDNLYNRIHSGNNVRKQKRNNQVKKIKGAFKAIKEVGQNILDDINGPEKNLEVEEFLESRIFKDLVGYQNFLKSDQRGHRFFCKDFTVRNKAGVLQELIDAINAQTTMQGISELLHDYKNTDGYATLNKGQNITTRVLGLKTTTVERFDAVLDTVDNYLKEDTDEKTSLIRFN